MRDVFYFGAKPNVHPRERYAKSLEDAKSQSTTEHFWIVNEHSDYSNHDWDFDFDLLPDDQVWTEDHINIWPSQYHKDSGTWLCPTDNNHPDKIYRNDVTPIARITSDDHWVMLDDIDKSSFDFSWYPDPDDPPYIYVWGCKYYPAEIKHVLEYRVPGATEIKYMTGIVELNPQWDRWEILEDIEMDLFDFGWRPDPREPNYIFVFGNQHYGSEEYPTVRYYSPKATQSKFEPAYVAKFKPQWDRWEILEDIDISSFDFTWRPHPDEPPYIYQFGTLADKNDGPRYITPDNDGEIVYRTRTYIKDNITVNRYYIETSLEELVKQHPNEIFWAMKPRINYDHFDFNWRPDLVETEWESDYVHTFGSKDSEITQTYFVNAKKYLEGKTEIKFVENIQLDEISLSKLFEKPSMFFIDKGNEKSKERFNQLKLLFPTIQKTRYLNSWVDTINRCTTKSKTELLWILSSELDYSNFDFDYYPNPWQSEMVHVFGTQWSKWGSTYLVNKETFTKDSKYLKHVEHMKTLNFVDRNAITENTYDIVMIDHGNEYSFDSDYTVDYNKSYLQTIKDLLEILPEQRDHYIWLCSSVCDYSDFDFSYQVNPFSREQLNVFASGTQKFGDTFMMDVNKMRDIIDEIDDLEEARLNFNNDLLVNRYDAPCIIHGSDSHVEIDVDKSFPYTTFITEDNKDIINNIEPMNLWDSEKKNILIGSTGASIIVVPKEASDLIRTEMYDYPHVKRMPKLEQSKPLDIIFLSNGESCAEENWEHLNSLNIPNRIVRVDGINGRAAAYHAAANASETPWFFTVFAKLKVNEKFDWDWQPDRMQQPKHYIFHAKNPVTGLTYGHQAMIAYNKKLVLANDGTKGLDFTLDDNHEVVPLKSGIATYNSDEFTTWRTAFREVIKLMNDDSNMSKLRLEKWLTVGDGEYGEYSIQGAKDAKDYYEEVDGDWHKIRQSYEWEWLREKFSKK